MSLTPGEAAFGRHLQCNTAVTDIEDHRPTDGISKPLLLHPMPEPIPTFVGLQKIESHEAILLHPRLQKKLLEPVPSCL